jgi:hypothetical protein
MDYQRISDATLVERERSFVITKNIERSLPGEGHAYSSEQEKEAVCKLRNDFAAEGPSGGESPGRWTATRVLLAVVGLIMMVLLVLHRRDKGMR